MSEYDSESRPVECYRFEIDGYAPMLFTSDEMAVTAEGDTYAPLPGLSRSSLKIVTTAESSDLTVTVPATSLLANRCGLFLTPQTVRLQFRRYQRADLDTPVMQFDATLAGASVRGGSCLLTFGDPLATGLAVKIPKHRLQTMCNWTLGDSNCAKDLADFLANVDQIAEVMNFTRPVAGRYTTQCSWADGVTPYDPLFWKGGVITGVNGDVTERRTIFALSFVGGEVARFSLRAVLTLSRSFDIPLAGSTFTITPGCDNSFERCAVLQNTARFGGFSYVPTERESPFETDLSKVRKT